MLLESEERWEAEATWEEARDLDGVRDGAAECALYDWLVLALGCLSWIAVAV